MIFSQKRNKSTTNRCGIARGIEWWYFHRKIISQSTVIVEKLYSTDIMIV